MNSWEQIGESMVRLLLAMVLGGVIGWQRESADKPAGFRTHILVSVGAALFTIGTALGVFGVNIEHVDLSGRSGDRVVLELALRLPPRVSRDELLVALGEVEGVEEVRWEDASAAA